MELYPLIDSVTRHLDRLSCRVGIGLAFGADEVVGDLEHRVLRWIQESRAHDDAIREREDVVETQPRLSLIDGGARRHDEADERWREDDGAVDLSANDVEVPTLRPRSLRSVERVRPHPMTLAVGRAG